MQKDSAFIFCAKVVGGHEKMCLQMIIDAYPDAELYIPRNNHRLKELLEDKGYDIYFHDACSQSMQSFQTIFNLRQIFSALNLLNKIANKNIILVQGDIELGSQFLVAAKLLKKNVTSYIPYAHTFKMMRKPMSWGRDFLSKYYYKLCNHYITISDCFKEDLLYLNPHAQVDIFPNYVITPSVPFYCRENDSPIKLFLIGRVEFYQKGHDLFIQALTMLNGKASWSKIEVHFIGDGKDLEELKCLCKQFNNITVEIDFIFHGWLNDVWSVAYQADLIVIPSRYEGVPLVMLEAIQLGKKVIASDRDGMRDYLKPEYLFNILVQKEFSEKIFDFLENKI